MLLFFLPITHKNLKLRFEFFARKFSGREFEDFTDLGLGQAERPAVRRTTSRRRGRENGRKPGPTLQIGGMVNARKKKT